MIGPAGEAVARLDPTLRHYGFTLLSSQDYEVRYGRGRLTLLYSCGRYAEDLMGIVVDAANHRFQMGSFLQVVDPDGFATIRRVARENSVSAIDFTAANFSVIAARYHAGLEAVLVRFMASWPDGADTVPAEIANWMDKAAAADMARFGLAPQDGPVE